MKLPLVAILDTQSVKTATPAAIEVGYDSAKQIKGRKRHLLVDTLGLVLIVVVTAASVPERAGAIAGFSSSSTGALLGGAIGCDLGGWWLALDKTSCNG